MWSITYVFSIVAVNLSFEFIPALVLPGEIFWSVGSILAGLVFILRDYSQIEVGKAGSLGLMALAGVITYLMASPFVAIASLVAFAASELCDFMSFNLIKGDFKRKVIASSLFSVPVDTVIFLSMIGHMSSATFIVMTLSKLVAISYLAVKK
jgi:queuosine precursor transporter